MFRIFGILIATLLIVAFVYTFGSDAYERYKVSERLKSVMTSQETAEFNNWTGDANSFARRLYERCELTQGRGAVQCDRYKFALESR